MQLSIDLLRTFIAVVDTSSFTKAGLIVHRTQSAVSMQMKRLEDEIGRPLFEKNGKSFGLSVTGELLIDHARRVLKAHDDALSVIREPELTGRIRFGSAVDYAARFLPGILARFAETHPNILVDMCCDQSETLLKILERGELDLAVFTEIGQGRLLRREPVVWITSDRCLVHEEDPLPLAVYHEGCMFRKWAIEALTRLGRDYRIAYVSPSILGILAAVEAGLAVSPMGAFNVRPGFRVLGPGDGFPPLPSASITLVKAPTAESAVAAYFADHVAASFQTLDRVPHRPPHITLDMGNPFTASLLEREPI